MIEFKDVHASYDAALPILKGVSFAVERGEFVAFVGTNGAGKSTTMRLVNGLLKPDSGQVLVDGHWHDVVGTPDDWTRGPWHNPASGVIVELRRVDG